MDHIAIMNKSRKLIDKILAGEKQIETRWYQTRRAPRDRVTAGDTIYFKDAGDPVTAKAKVSKVLQFSTDEQNMLATSKHIAETYGDRIAFVNPDYTKREKKYRYAILMFLEEPQLVEPFAIDKTGYGNAAAWMCVGNINSVRVR